MINNKIRAFIFSPLLDYVLGLCYVMDAKKSVSSHSNPPVRGPKLSHGPIGTYGIGTYGKGKK